MKSTSLPTFLGLKEYGIMAILCALWLNHWAWSCWAEAMEH